LISSPEHDARPSASEATFAMRAASSHLLVSPSRVATPSRARGADRSVRPLVEPSRVRRRLVASAGFDLDALMPVSIEGDLEGLQEEAGANFDDDGVPLDYGDSEKELEALRAAVGVVDRGSVRWRVIRVAGRSVFPSLEAAGASRVAIERLLRLGPQEGAAVEFSAASKEGEATRVKRALAMCHVQSSGILIVAPGFVADAIAAAASADECVDLSDGLCFFLSLVGPQTAELLKKAGVVGVIDPGSALGTHRTFGFEGRPVVATNGGWELYDSEASSAKGPPENTMNVVNLIVEEGVAGLLWAAVTGLGAEPVGITALDEWAKEQSANP